MKRLLALLAVLLFAAEAAVAMEFCSGRVRVTCVVDGDTVWIDGEKIRLADIDAPEVSAPCVEARLVSARAAGRLVELLSAGSYVIERGDEASGQTRDRFGRTLAVIRLDGVSVGLILVAEGLARPWNGRREDWC